MRGYEWYDSTNDTTVRNNMRAMTVHNSMKWYNGMKATKDNNGTTATLVYETMTDTTVRKATKDMMVRKATKGTSSRKGYKRYERYLGYKKWCENISMVACRISMGIQYRKLMGFNQWWRLIEKKWIDGDGSDWQTWNKSKVERID